MKPDTGVERCSICESELHPRGTKGYGALRVHENDKHIVLQHCPVCGALLIHIETLSAHSR